MKVLITSGGTKIPIDMVRSITNMSRGTFGAKIAESFAASDEVEHHELIFLMAKDSCRPDTGGKCVRWFEYVTFDDYKENLFYLLETFKPDIVVLAAAVSDYTVENPVNGKIRSSGDMTIHLVPTPKLISSVRSYVPDAVICGFKLLVNSNDDELKKACLDSIEKNNIDMVVGNDLRDMKMNNHRLSIYRKYTAKPEVACHVYDKRHSDKLASCVSWECIDCFNEKKKK